MPDAVPVTRALLSVSDKSGLIELAQALAAGGVELVSTGGTAAQLRSAGLTIVDVAEITGFPEMMDGRVKTLHPAVHAGLLARRDNREHLTAMADHGIGPIDLAVVNLYPFEATAAARAGYDECVENIDIGGPAMIRAAAKNHAFVTVVVNVEDYAALLAELEAHDGATTLAFRQRLAETAYARTAAYDAAVRPGWRAPSARRSRVGAPLPVGSRNLCATARTRIKAPPFIAMARTGPAWRPRPSIRAKSCRITTSTTPMRRLNWWQRLTPAQVLRAPLSSTPTQAAWRSAKLLSALTSVPSIATAPPHLAGLSR